MIGHPSVAPRRRPRRRGLIALVAGLCTLITVAGVLALGSVTGVLGDVLHPLVDPAPWGEGDTIRPVDSTDPQVRSVLRSQQYDVAWASLMEPDGQQTITQEYSFDPERRRGGHPKPTTHPPSYRAGISAYAYSADGDGKRPYEFHVDEYGDPSDATAATRADRARWSLRTVSSPAITGASHVVVGWAEPDSTRCGSAAGTPNSVGLLAVVDRAVELSLLSDCVRSNDGDRSVDTMIAIATKAVRAIRTAPEQPMPASWMPDTADIPIISSGDWHQSQLRVTGRRDGLNVDPLLDAPFAGSGVRTVFHAQDTVYVDPGRTAAHRVLSRIPKTYEGSHLYVDAPHRVDRGASDERLCAESIHWQLGTTCWSRVGRFVVVQSYGDVLFGKLDGWIDESQTEALQQVR